jgi:hypothetical protein
MDFPLWNQLTPLSGSPLWYVRKISKGSGHSLRYEDRMELLLCCCSTRARMGWLDGTGFTWVMISGIIWLMVFDPAYTSNLELYHARSSCEPTGQGLTVTLKIHYFDTWPWHGVLRTGVNGMKWSAGSHVERKFAEMILTLGKLMKQL